MRAIPPRTVDVWIEAFAFEDGDWGSLSSEEQARASRFHFEVDRQCYGRSHARLRRILAEYLAEDPLALRFETGPFGKPRLTDRDLRFSLSHTHDRDGAGWFAVAVCGDAEVGIDLEIAPRGSVEELARLVCTERERAALAALAPTDRDRRFLRCWTAKEAFLKALGCGLQCPPETVEILGDDRVGWSIQADIPVVRAEDWRLLALDTPDGVTGSLALPRGHEARLVH